MKSVRTSHRMPHGHCADCFMMQYKIVSHILYVFKKTYTYVYYLVKHERKPSRGSQNRHTRAKAPPKQPTAECNHIYGVLLATESSACTQHISMHESMHPCLLHTHTHLTTLARARLRIKIHARSVTTHQNHHHTQHIRKPPHTAHSGARKYMHTRHAACSTKSFSAAARTLSTYE